MRGYKMIEFASHRSALHYLSEVSGQLSDGDVIQEKNYDAGGNQSLKSQAHHTMFVYSVGSEIEYAQHTENKIAILEEYLGSNLDNRQCLTFYIITPNF